MEGRWKEMEKKKGWRVLIGKEKESDTEGREDGYRRKRRMQ